MEGNIFSTTTLVLSFFSIPTPFVSGIKHGLMKKKKWSYCNLICTRAVKGFLHIPLGLALQKDMDEQRISVFHLCTSRTAGRIQEQTTSQKYGNKCTASTFAVSFLIFQGRNLQTLLSIMQRE